jgi:hypothetical protein
VVLVRLTGHFWLAGFTRRTMRTWLRALPTFFLLLQQVDRVRVPANNQRAMNPRDNAYFCARSTQTSRWSEVSASFRPGS